MHATYFIPRENEKSFTEKLTKLARKATKLGLAVITYAAIRTLSLERTRYRVVTDAMGNETTKSYTVTVEHVAYTIEGEAPTLSGWTFAATIEHEAGVNILRSITGETLPVRFRDATPEHCDHCGYVRNRKDTFIVRNEAGEYQQVGRNCLKDFLGNKSPADVAEYAVALHDFFARIGKEDDEGFATSGTAIETYALVSFLAATAACISSNGWVSRSVAREEDKTATADIVVEHLDAQSNSHMSESNRKAHTIPGADSEENTAIALAAIEWANQQNSEGNDYIHNLQAITKLDYVTKRTAGYAASIVSGHFRATERAMNTMILKADGTDHVGTIGKREEMILTLIAVFSIEGDYGVTDIHKFADVEGNAVVWFASNGAVVPASDAHPETRNWVINSDKVPMIKGATYRVKATVKDHTEYNGQAQTKVTRVAVQPLVKVKKTRKRKSAQRELAV